MIKLLLEYIWIAVQLLIGYNLIFPILLYFFYSLVKTKKRFPDPVPREADYAIIVTAYEQIIHLPAVVQSLLNMRYNNYIIYIVADSCDISSLRFKDNRVVILKPPTRLMSNVRSHFYAINHFVRAHERLTIIDSDNLVHPDYLKELNKYFERGYMAVQGPRMPKNLNTTYACLDAAREIYYHFYDGKLLFALGSSATLAGSGMAFETNLYIQCMGYYANLNGAGFDKVLQAEIVKRDYQIAFAEKAIVYDQKTSYSDQLVNQRTRWIQTWFRYFDYGFSLIKEGMANRSVNQLLFGIVLLRPPLFMFLLLSVVCLLINVAINPFYCFIWLSAFFVFIAGFYVALIKSNTSRQIYKSFAGVPLFMFYQVVSVFKVRSKKGNIATRHFDVPAVENLNDLST
jgi:cellulose synthase/poly-beta-1,6-N-acetylglucosamine synthase-like glycosyltransferase